MDKNKIKILIIIVIAILIYVGIVFLADRSATKEERTIESQDVLIINKDYMYIKTAGVWSFATPEEYNKILPRKDFQIFSNGEYVGTYRIKFMNYYFYYIDKNGNEKQLKYPVWFYSSPVNTIESLAFEYENMDESDDKLAKSYLDSDVFYPSSPYEFTNHKKIVFDYDNDGVKEKMLFVSTGYSNEFSDSKKVFGMVLYVDGSDVQVVFKNVADRGTPESEFYEYFLMSVYKFSNQDKNTIVLGRNIPMGGLEFCPTIFEFNGNKLEEKVTCKEGNL